MAGIFLGIPSFYRSLGRHAPKRSLKALTLASTRLLCVISISFFSSLLSAQPVPCGPNPDMTPNCIDACVICDIDGYEGINESSTSGQEPPGFCTNTAHHMQWIAFIAGSTNLTITVTPSDCDEGDGLEVGIYQSLNCSTFQLVSNCDGDIQEGQIGVFSNTLPLVIGQYYYFVMDGNMNDICEYVIHVTSGTTLVPPLPDISAIQGPDTLCLVESEMYSIAAITGATSYVWTLNGTIAGNGISTDISFPGPGQYELCALAYNVCDTTAPACQVITVLPISSSQDSVSLCDGDCLILEDTTICDSGLYSLRYTNVAGCDSIVNLTVTVHSSMEFDLDATICSTDSIQAGGSWYSLPGTYVITVFTPSGCDSIINLTLQTIVCEFDGQILATDARCAGDSSGQITLELLSGNPPFTFNWEQAGNAFSGTGTIPNINTLVTISDLPAGLFIFTIHDSFGNDLILSASVDEPPALELQLLATDYNGFNISCAGETDGQIMAVVQGGTPGYQYLWNTNESVLEISSLGPQVYSLTVTDAVGCAIIGEISLVEPAQLEPAVLFSDPGCEGPTTGNIQVVTLLGGAPPYQYSLSSGHPGSAGTFNNLPEGSYTLSITDANGCKTDTTGVLTASIIPHIEVGNDIEIELGYSTNLFGTVNPSDALIEWTPASTLSCAFCLDPLAMPVITTVYTFTATSVDGCIKSDSLTVFVRKSDDAVYIPNAFSPNSDGINDYFTIFANRSVKDIAKLTIYSRWGELVFEEYGFLPNETMTGWDGTFRDKLMQPAVFTWIAEIRFLDDEVIMYSGDLTLIR